MYTQYPYHKIDLYPPCDWFSYVIKGFHKTKYIKDLKHTKYQVKLGIFFFFLANLMGAVFYIIPCRRTNVQYSTWNKFWKLF